MTGGVFGDGTPAASQIVIENMVQKGPARLTGQFGTRLDYTNDGAMLFVVSVVDVEDNYLTLLDDLSYEKAIVEAEEAAAEWGVPVNDICAP